jgi:hypothetical protein
MALLISSSEIESCECCGCKEHGTKRWYAYCYAGLEWLLDKDPNDPHGRIEADTYNHRDGHPVEAVDIRYCFTGWGKRGGRLPICPEHRIPTDEDF